MSAPQKWTEIIESQTPLLDLQLREVWRYRDLLAQFVKRDFLARFKQTILGPVWFVVQPILTTITFMVVFGGIAKISTDEVPAPVFYMAGLTCWNYFSNSLVVTSSTFISNAGIFGKVYFPRLITPLAITISNLIQFCIQFMLFLAVLSYYIYQGRVLPNLYALLTPVLILLLAGTALGIGIIVSSVTTRYRDFNVLLGFTISLAMYATPVIYPASSVSEKYRWIVKANPLTYIIEAFKFGFTGKGMLSWPGLGYSSLFMTIVLFIGIVLFNKVEKTFMDTV